MGNAILKAPTPADTGPRFVPHEFFVRCQARRLAPVCGKRGISGMSNRVNLLSICDSSYDSPDYSSAPGTALQCAHTLTRCVSEVSTFPILAYASGWYGLMNNPGWERRGK